MNQVKCSTCPFKSNAASKLNSEQLSLLSDNCAGVKFKRGDILMQQGALSSNIAYLKTGLAKIHITGPYHEQIVKLIKAPAYLGLPNTFGDKINNYSVTVIEDSNVCFINIDVFKQLFAENHGFAYEILITLCNYELDSFRRCANRTQKQLRGNVADVILDFSQRLYDSLEFNLPLNRSEIGNLIDTSRESVSRILAEFVSDGIIANSGRKMEILDLEKLKLISSKG